jgi:hypothetical protein
MDPERVLVISHSDISRQAAYELTKVLNSFGYAVDLCNNGDETNVKADKMLDGEAGVSGYAGLVILDDGGNTTACIELAKKADKAEMPVGGHDEGCLILYLAGLLKGKYVCAGLPDEVSGKSKPVGAPSVRSDNIVTARGNCVEGFAVLMIDALGGKIKKVVRSSPSELPWRTALVIDEPSEWPRYWGVAKSVAGSGGKVAVAAWGDVDAKAGVASSCILLDAAGGSVRKIDNAAMPRKVWMRQRSVDVAAVVGALEANGFSSVNSAKACEKAKSSDLADMLGGVVQVGGGGEEVVCSASRTAAGWEVTAVSAARALPAIDVSRVVDAATAACVAFQAALDGPDEANELGVVVRIGESGASVSAIDPISPLPRDNPPVELGEREKLLMERELAHEGIYLQPDGSIAMRSGGRLEKLDPNEAVARLQKGALEAAKAEASADESSRRGLGMAARAARHRLRLLCALRSMMDKSKNTRVAGPYDSTSTGWYSNLDVPMFERVWEYNEDDDYLEDRDKAISNQPRYNPEYDRNGFYFVWNEPRREPTAWARILEGDSVYPSRKILQRR